MILQIWRDERMRDRQSPDDPLRHTIPSSVSQSIPDMRLSTLPAHELVHIARVSRLGVDKLRDALEAPRCTTHASVPASTASARLGRGSDKADTYASSTPLHYASRSILVSVDSTSSRARPTHPPVSQSSSASLSTLRNCVTSSSTLARRWSALRFLSREWSRSSR